MRPTATPTETDPRIASVAAALADGLAAARLRRARRLYEGYRGATATEEDVRLQIATRLPTGPEWDWNVAQ